MATATVSGHLGTLPVLDTEGASHPFASLSADRPLVVAFVRHFG